MLGEVALETGGKVTRVNPTELTKEFSNFLKNKLIATGVVLNVQIHKSLSFTGEDDADLFNKKSNL